METLHFRRSGGEGDQGFDECLEFAIVWGARQSGEEFVESVLYSYVFSDV